MAAVIVTALFGVATIVATYRSARPRRRLYVYSTATTRLVHGHGASLDLEVRHQGAVVRDPHLITVHLASRGRRDILKEHFADPITLQLHVPLIELLESTSNAKSGAIPPPVPRILADRIEVGPALIGRDQRISYTVLVDGKPRLDPLCPLGDVDVRLFSNEYNKQFRFEAALASAALANVFVGLALMLSPTPANSKIEGLFVLVLGMGAFLAGGLVWQFFKRANKALHDK